MRADQALVERGLAPSRSLAQRLIAAGAVRLVDLRGERAVRRPAEPVADDARLTVLASDETRFASRAGAKLAHALALTGANPRDATALDIGQSTGGFTDCLLTQGVRRVVGVDVGHGQLVPRLRADPRVVCLEGLNARELTPERLAEAWRGEDPPPLAFDWVVIDVSFISLALVLPTARALARPGATLMALVKPQFEVGPQGVDSRGLVRSDTLYPVVRERIVQAAIDTGWRVADWLDSGLVGGDGNREFFLHAHRAS